MKYFIVCLLWFFHVSADELGYQTIVYGVNDLKLLERIKEEASLFTLEHSEPESLQVLRRRAISDLTKLQKFLASEGYYDAGLDYFIDTKSKPITVYLKVELGVRYKLGAFKIKDKTGENPSIEEYSRNIGELGIVLGEPARAAKVKKASEDLLGNLQKHGYPFAEIAKTYIVVDRTQKEMQAAFLIDPKKLARFGEVIIESTGGVHPSFIQARLKWKEGDVYQRSKIVDTIEALTNTRLFSAVRIWLDDKTDDAGTVAVRIKIDKKKYDAFHFTTQYSGGLGVNTSGIWERRNFFGTGELFSLKADFGKHKKRLSARFLKPDSFHPNLDVITTVIVGSERYKGYSKDGMRATVAGQYPVLKGLSVQAGVRLDLWRILKDDSDSPGRLLSVPMHIRFSKDFNHFLYDAKLKITPQMTVFTALKTFVKVDFYHHMWLNLVKNKKLRLKLWNRIGAFPGGGKKSIPTYRLFYLGGEKGLRGYRYQMGGPLDGKRMPIGGKSLLSFGSELEYRLTQQLSIVTFLDWGTVFSAQYPDLSEPLLWGVGSGIMYKGEYGDLSLSIAAPVKRRNIDRNIEFYLRYNSHF